MNKIPENIVGELFVQNDTNEFEGPFGKQNLNKFLKENPKYYTSGMAEKQVTYRLFLDENKRNALRIEEKLIKDEWFE